MNKFGIVIVTIILFTCINSEGQDLRQIENLSGSWKFSVGDNPHWALPDYDDSDWNRIRVPGRWEDQGYEDYDGYAWYRKTFEMENMDWDHPVFLCLGRIDDVSEIFINGKLYARTGSFPPHYETKYGEERIFTVTKDILPADTEITIAIRVYDMIMEGGIVGGKVGIYYDYDLNYIDIPLSGIWKFRIGKDDGWAKENLNDDDWDDLNVPEKWENQGYDDYDGYAWYRKSFTLSSSDIKRDQYLVLGKIDDYDYVYLNGKLLGSYKSLRNDFNWPRERDIWRNIRYYPIPDDLLKPGKNVIAVQVLDEQGDGGIYAGPVGITSEEYYRRLSRKYHQDNTFWEFLFESIFD
ncbi:MAG: beta galactosidase jelly roll domain-containing protein [Prolixibacteraceae bacterium]|nr:beta galactosidase jelly roll domain-containing protein [Prolixibacteraceae bacterium]MBN2774622.1 beta galactosidase jelly roll domain-containing protein [Prolixibacteraceae bacterium]